jgi:hypothetical protein
VSGFLRGDIPADDLRLQMRRTCLWHLETPGAMRCDELGESGMMCRRHWLQRRAVLAAARGCMVIGINDGVMDWPAMREAAPFFGMRIGRAVP